MFNKKLGVWVAVISYRRSANIGPMSALIGNATWYVGKDEEQRYRNGGAEFVRASGDVISSRNAALEDAAKHKLPCLQISDDLVRLKQVVIVAGQKNQSKPISFMAAVDLMMSALLETNAKLAGVAPTANPFFFNPKSVVSTNHFIVGDLMLIMPTKLRFDPQFQFKEDYDFTLQNLKAFGCVARYNGILAEFKHYTNKGGAVAFRTTAKEQVVIARLKAKWGDCISDNTKRPNEILLRPKHLKVTK